MKSVSGKCDSCGMEDVEITPADGAPLKSRVLTQ
jgi:hypothetical protein